MPLSEQQQIEKDQADSLLTKAQQMMDEGHDDVKQMNQMMLYSKVVTIRDRQLEEAKRLEQEWVEEQKRLDLMMEIERLKSLKLQEEERERRMDFVPEKSEVDTETIYVDADTKQMIKYV